MMKWFLISGIGFALVVNSLHGWSNHGLGTFLSLSNTRSISHAPFVKVESLEGFLEKEKVPLEEFLKHLESELSSRISHYTSDPKGAVFKKGSKDLRMDFLKSLRLNPNIRLGYYIQEIPGISLSKPIYPNSEITIFQDFRFLEKNVFRTINIGSIQSPLYVLATAVDEPDYGMDVGLFEDNGTEFGHSYGFGIQPFGDPQLEYSSQAPFHMGFFYEKKLIYSLAGFLGQTYPEARAYQFLQLSRFAFRTGHEYWGYRFLGWGLHYIQDLTQPYHTRVLPQYSSGKMVGINLLAMVGFSSGKESAVQRVSSRHRFVESYKYEMIRKLMLQKDATKNPFVQAFIKRENIEIPIDIFAYPRVTVAKESSDRADELDARIEEFAGNFLVKDWSFAELPTSKERENMDILLLELAENFGYHTRVILNWAKSKNTR